MGIQIEKGEGLVLRNQGALDQCVEFPKHIVGGPQNLNKGKHTVHVSGRYDSNLLVPVVAA